MSSFNELVDAILIINLKHRQDRLEESLNILKESNIEMSKVRIIDATYIPSNGAKGCSHSHYNAIKHAKEHDYKNVLILEDDFKWNLPFEKIEKRLCLTVEKNPDWKVLQLSWGLNNYKKRASLVPGNKFIRRLCHPLRGSWLTTAYFVNACMYDMLIQNFFESYEKQNIEREKSFYRWVLDRYWWKVQRQVDWDIFIPKLVVPRDPNDTDIVKTEKK